MFGHCKIIQGVVGCRRATAVLKCRPGLNYTCCGGGDKQGDDGDDPCEPCDVCPACQCPSDYNPSTPTTYDCRKYSHCLPTNNVSPCFEPLPNIPTGIFRCTTGEVLGPGAAKCSYYQVPEYFSFQHMTYYDMHLILRSCRNPSPDTLRKPN